VGAATTPDACATLKALLAGTHTVPDVTLSSRERFRIVERLLAHGDADAEALLAAQTQADASDDGRRYAYAAAAARSDAATKAKYFAAWFDDRALAESWIEESVAPFNTVEQATLTAPYLERALKRLPQLKRERRIFFVNRWLDAFLGGQTDAASLRVTRKFLKEAKLDPDLRRKVLEALDELERTVRTRATFGADRVSPPARLRRRPARSRLRNA
jgi:aminopeptidase N